jgi:hypothetical protein
MRKLQVSEMYEFFKYVLSMVGIIFILILIIGFAIQKYEEREK